MYSFMEVFIGRYATRVTGIISNGIWRGMDDIFDQTCSKGIIYGYLLRVRVIRILEDESPRSDTTKIAVHLSKLATFVDA